MNPYTVLGVRSSASEKELKKAYKKLRSENHPDKMIAKGASDAEIKKATEKSQSIQEAYDKIKNGEYVESSFEFKPKTKWHESSTKYSGDYGYQQYYRDNGQRSQTYSLDATVEQLYDGFTIDATSSGLCEFNVPKGAIHKTHMYVMNKRIEINVVKDPKSRYTVHRNTVYTGAAVSTIDALLGTEITFEHLNGKSYKVKVPKGTKDKKEIVMPELGLFDRHTGKRDNLIFIVYVETISIFDEETIDMLTKKGYYKHSYSIGK